MADIEVVLHDPASDSTKRGGIELLDEWDVDGGAWVWVDVSGASDETEREVLGERFGVPHLAIQDANRERHPPKLEVFNKLVFIILRDLRTDAGFHEHRGPQISLFLGTNFLVSRHDYEVPSLKATFDAAQLNTGSLSKGPAHIAYLISRRIVDNYTPVVLELEERLAELEDVLFDQNDDHVIELITRHSRSLKRLRRILVYQRDVIVQLCRPAVPLPVKLSKHEFNDVFEHMERLASLCQLNQELASDLLNTHLSLASHRLNQVMRILTITTVIFLPLALLAGIYGMNFQYMPELTWHYGYFGALATMAVIVILLVVTFKRRGWL